MALITHRNKNTGNFISYTQHKYKQHKATTHEIGVRIKHELVLTLKRPSNVYFVEYVK